MGTSTTSWEIEMDGTSSLVAPKRFGELFDCGEDLNDANNPPLEFAGGGAETWAVWGTALEQCVGDVSLSTDKYSNTLPPFADTAMSSGVLPY